MTVTCRTCQCAFTPLVHRMLFSVSDATACSLKVIRPSLLRSGGVTERPGEAEGVTTGVGLRLLRRMDWGVKAEKPGPEAAKARARCWERKKKGEKMTDRHLNYNLKGYISGKIRKILIYFDNLRCLKQTEFWCFLDSTWRKARTWEPGRTEKRPRGLAGGMNHQIYQPESQRRRRS